MFLALREDAVHWVPTTTGADTAFNRRAFVRATIAFVEGLTYSMKRVALAMYDAGEATASAADLVILREKAYHLTDTGEAKERPAKLRTLSNWRFAFRSFARAHGYTASLKVDGPGWQRLQAAIEIRNRLLHPKSRADLAVSDDDVEIVNAAGRWVQDATMELFAALANHSRDRLRAMLHLPQ